MVVWDKLTKINTFYAEEFAYLLKRLKETPVAGGGTLLDQALIVWGTEIDNGNSHDHFDMPFVLAGGGAGRLNGARSWITRARSTSGARSTRTRRASATTRTCC
jgi:hypothetical protein